MTRHLVQPAIYHATYDRCGDQINDREYLPSEVSPVQLTQYAWGLMGKTIDLCVNCTIMFRDVFMQSGKDAH